MQSPNVEIVQDHLVQRGGAERVLLSMSRALPEAAIHTAFYWPEACYAEFADLDIRPMPIDRVPGLRERHRMALPLLPLAFNRLRVDADVVVCGTSGWAAGARTDGRKVLYFHSLARWLHERGPYMASRSRAEATGLRAITPWLRRWDRRAVLSAHRRLVYSSAMAEQVHRAYGIGAEVLPPPLTLWSSDVAEPPADLEPGFVLCPARLMTYKNVDAVVDAFRLRPGDRLVVAGGGPEERRLRSIAPPNVTLLGQVGDAAMRWLYGACRLVVSAAFEPFGLVTLEANAAGKPVAVLGEGGFRDTVVDGVTGRFFDEPNPTKIAATVGAVDAMGVHEDELRRHAEKWSEEAFITRLRTIVAEEAQRA